MEKVQHQEEHTTNLLGILVITTTAAALVVAILVLWEKSRQRRTAAELIAHNDDVSPEQLKQRVAAAAWSRSHPYYSSDGEEPKDQKKNKNSSLKNVVKERQKDDVRASSLLPTVAQQQQQDEMKSGLSSLSRPKDQKHDETDASIGGIRQATMGDEVAWKEERASREQFGGFSIYGHAPPAPTACCSMVASGSRDDGTSPLALSPTGFDAIQGISEIPNLPGSDQARNLLQQLCREFEPVVRARGWTVRNVVEMCCCSNNNGKPPSVAGYCVTSGDGRTAQRIHIRLRLPGSCQNHGLQFYPYQNNLVQTMAHELAHIKIQAHNDAFYKLMAELEDERVHFLANGSSSSGSISGVNHFSAIVATSSGRRLGTASGDGLSTAVIGSRDLKKLAAKAAAKRQAQNNTAVLEKKAKKN